MRLPRRRARGLLATAATLLLVACTPGSPALVGPSGGVDSPAPGGAIRNFDLTAEAATLELKPGLRVQAWTYNGTSPGPELRASVGDVLRVRLRNRLPVGTSLHWHGIDLPNGQDGVAGVTQDAVPPGGTAIYSFRLTQAGTYWYHSHQDSAVQQDRGLYGALIVLPRPALAVGLDRTLVYDEWPLGLESARPPAQADIAMRSYVTTTVNGHAGEAVIPIVSSAGETVRLRLINAGYSVHYVTSPVPVTVVALDGHELSGAAQTSTAIPVGPAERVDILFVAPATAFSLRLAGGFPPDGEAAQPIGPAGAAQGPSDDHPRPQVLDLLGLAAVAAGDPWPSGALPDRTFRMVLSQVAAGATTPGAMPAMAGMDGVSYRIDGSAFPGNPVLRVKSGDLVEITFQNDSASQHWMHLHGHSFRVLLRDGDPLPGSLVKDTVGVLPGHSITIAFRADNPGWWMIHCHQLLHAAGGMMALLAYDGAPRLAQLGGPSGNLPD